MTTREEYEAAISVEVAKLKHTCITFGYVWEEVEQRFQERCRTHQHLTIIQNIKELRRELIKESDVTLN